MREVKFDTLSLIQQRLLRTAVSVLDRAYCSYSGFAVGAAITTPDDKIFEGVNVENAAYGSSICAERSAVCHAVSRGEQEFSDLAIVVRNKGCATLDLVPPCGACRQFLNEFASLYDRDLTITLATLDFGQVGIIMLSDLLPRAFGPRDLGFARLGSKKQS